MTALLIIMLFLFLALFLGIRAQHGKDMNLEQWSVGGRGFGTIFVFLLMAGEIYTTFTFLGGSGWAYSKGAPTFYILGYGALAYILSYFLLPPVWKYAKEHNLVSQPDFFVKKYKSQTLGMIVSIVGVISIIPYLVLQLKGLGIIVSEASYGRVSPVIAVWIGAIVITIYVMVSGIHGSAWTAASTLLAKNIYRTMVPSASDRQVAKAAKLFVPVVTLVAVLFTFKGGETIGALLLMGYSIVTQLFPALVCSLFPRQVITKQGAIAGMGIGLLVVAYITLSGSTIATMFPSFPQYIKDLNVGIVALLMNMIVMFIVSGFTKNVSVKADNIIVEK